jgi:hypothetical protein
MKIEIKPKIITASDYHDFYPYEDKDFMELNFPMCCLEIEPSRESTNSFYQAIIWPEGAEDELFEFIFLDETAWEVLTKEE